MAALSLRRSTRLAHAHTETRKLKRHPPPSLDPEPDQDSSSSDPENELTPRALRALKRQRLARDLDALPFPHPRPKKRRKENTVRTDVAQRPRNRPSSPLTSQRTHAVENTATSDTPASTPSPVPEPSRDSSNDTTLSISISPPHPASTTFHELSLTATFPNKEIDPRPTKPALSIPLSPISAESLPMPTVTSRSPSTSPEPLTPLTPSPESSPSLPGHDRQVSVPPHDLLPPPVSLENLSLSHASHSTQRTSIALQQLPTESLPSPSLSTLSPSISLNPVLDTLIPFESLPPQFEHDLGVQMTSSPPVLDFPEQFPSFPQPQIYVAPYPDPRREANIWKLACRERVEYILKCTRKTIKELLAPETHGTRSPSPSLDPTGSEFNPSFPSQTKFRLYTPASYTYSSTSWGSRSGARKAFLMDEDMEDVDAGWAMDDSDWVDGDVDMEDEDEDEYEDDDDVGAGEGEDTLGAVEGLTIATLGTSTTPASDPPFEVDKSQMMQVDASERCGRSTTKGDTDPPIASRPVAPVDPLPPPSTPPYLPSPPSTPDRLPALSSLHVPLLSEPCRSFMGRGTPPDRRRLIEWSGAGRFAANGMGPPLYLSPVPQRDVGIVIDESMHSPTPPPQPTPGEWTSFLYSMLEGDGVGVGASVTDASHESESAWYELGLGSVPAAIPASELGVPLSHPHALPCTPAMEQVVDDGSSSSTLRFALG